MDASAPHRPPPPPPPLQLPDARSDIANPYYIDSPEQVTSPPSFAEALMAASPASPPGPPGYDPYSPGSPRLTRSLTGGTMTTHRFADEPSYAQDSGDDDEEHSAATTLAGDDHHQHQHPHPHPHPRHQQEPQSYRGGGYRDDADDAAPSHLGGENDGDDDDDDVDEDEDIPDLPPVIVITGAGSGLGLALFQHLSARSPARPDEARHDVVGVDRTPWRLPGKGFQWHTTIGRCGKFVQLDVVAASPRRLHAFARKHLYAPAPDASPPTPPSPSRTTSLAMPPPALAARARARRKKNRRMYPRPVSMLIHCAGTRGHVTSSSSAPAPAPAPAPGSGSQLTSGPGARASRPPTSPFSPANRPPPPPPPAPAAAPPPAELDTLDVMDAATMRRAHDVHVVGPFQLTQALLPHLQLHAERVRERQDELEAAGLLGAADADTSWLDQLRQQGSRASLQLGGPHHLGDPNNNHNPLVGGNNNSNGSINSSNGGQHNPLQSREPPPRVIVMSSRAGSVSANATGGAYAYRASKAALHAVIKSLSVDVPEVCFASVDPGTETGVSGPFAAGGARARSGGRARGAGEDVIGCDEAAGELLPLFEKLGDGKLASGCFVDRFGDPIKW